jgi:hypothetical protein
MSVCSFEGSDISDFAAWEASNPLTTGEIHEQSREQSLIDMAHPERVWDGEDSSNDARSSDGESEGAAAKKSAHKAQQISTNGGGGKVKLPPGIPSSTEVRFGTVGQGSDGINGEEAAKDSCDFDSQGRQLVRFLMWWRGTLKHGGGIDGG